MRLKALLDDLGLKSFPLLSGGKGIHVVAPLDAIEGLADGQELRRALQPRHRRGRAGDVHRQHPQGRSARAASSSTGCATSAARPRSCLIPPAPAKARRCRRRRLGRARPISRAAIISASAMRTNCSSARLEDACGLGQGQASVAGCVSTSRRLLLRAFALLPHRRLAAGARSMARAKPSRVTITRDDWGIAHVHGKTDADAVFGMIYAQAEDDFPRIEANYLTNLGRTAEAEGEKAIWQDLRARLYVSDNELKADYARSPPSMRRLMDAWADGPELFPRHPPKRAPARAHAVRAVDGDELHRRQHRRRHRADRSRRARGLLRQEGRRSHRRSPTPNRGAQTALRSRRS